MAPRNGATNSHEAHPTRVVERCLWTGCGKLHLPYTKLAKVHRSRALRETMEHTPDREHAAYNAIVDAPNLRAARKAASDLWRSAHRD